MGGWKLSEGNCRPSLLYSPLASLRFSIKSGPVRLTPPPLTSIKAPFLRGFFYLEKMDTLKRWLKEPIAYVLVIQISILIIILCPFRAWNTSDEIRLDNCSTITTTKPSIVEATTIQDRKVTTTSDPIIQNEKKNTTVLTITQIDGYYTVKRERDYVTVQKRCDDCVKLYFNKTQLLEITKFLHSCFFEGKCDPTGFTENRIYCLVCNPSISLRYSGLTFCIDFNQNLNCGFIGSYIFYSDLLYALYSFRDKIP